jgi:hypothetical protein
LYQTALAPETLVQSTDGKFGNRAVPGLHARFYISIDHNDIKTLQRLVLQQQQQLSATYTPHPDEGLSAHLAAERPASQLSATQS